MVDIFQMLTFNSHKMLLSRSMRGFLTSDRLKADIFSAFNHISGEEF